MYQDLVNGTPVPPSEVLMGHKRISVQLVRDQWQSGSVNDPDHKG